MQAAPRPHLRLLVPWRNLTKQRGSGHVPGRGCTVPTLVQLYRITEEASLLPSPPSNPLQMTSVLPRLCDVKHRWSSRHEMWRLLFPACHPETYLRSMRLLMPKAGRWGRDSWLAMIPPQPSCSEAPTISVLQLVLRMAANSYRQRSTYYQWKFVYPPSFRRSTRFTLCNRANPGPAKRLQLRWRPSHSCEDRFANCLGERILHCSQFLLVCGIRS